MTCIKTVMSGCCNLGISRVLWDYYDLNLYKVYVKTSLYTYE